MVEGGFPHSEILGSKLVRSSPRLIAAYHVLHRLSAPRHPPDALKALDRSHDRCPPSLHPGQRSVPPLPRGHTDVRPSIPDGELKSAPSAKGTDDQKDLSLDLSKDVCLPDAPAPRTPKDPRWFGRTPKARPQPHASPLHDVKHPQERASARPANCSKTSGSPALGPGDARSRSPQNPQPDGSNRPPAGPWWSQTGSNRRPPACKAGALPTELWPRLW